MNGRALLRLVVGLSLGASACRDQDPRSIEGRSAFHQAIIRGNQEAVAVFLRRGAEPNEPPSDHFRCFTPLALADDSVPIAKLLLDNGANPDAPAGKDGETALMCATKSDVAVLLLERGANPNAVDHAGITPLMAVAGRELRAYSSESDELAIARRLIDLGVPLDAQSTNGETALMHAARAGRLEMVKLLVERRARINIRSNEHIAAIEIAASLGHDAIFTTLREAGASVPRGVRVIKKRTVEGLESVLTERGTIRLHEAWDDALPKLGVRLQLRRDGPDRFVDTRLLNDQSYSFTFERPSEPALGPYRLVKIEIE